LVERLVYSTNLPITAAGIREDATMTLRFVPWRHKTYQDKGLATQRLTLEALEDRNLLSSATVVPLTHAIDGKTTFFRIEDALSVAISPGDVITIESGVTANLGPVQVNANGITIQADPNTLAGSLPVLDFVLSGSHVTLSRLNLGSITINPDSSTDAIVHCDVDNVTILGGQSGAGGNVVDQDVITGSVVMTGLLAVPQVGNRITNSTFKSSTPNTTNAIIAVEDNNGVVITNNQINGLGAAGQDGLRITRGVNHVIANNTITLNGADQTTHGIIVQNPGGGPPMTATITNNHVSTNQGVGLFVNAFNDTNLQALVQGNDFHGNAVGVDYLGSGGASIASDLGGGSNNLGSVSPQSPLTRMRRSASAAPGRTPPLPRRKTSLTIRRTRPQPFS
jgi:hypothetical protein